MARRDIEDRLLREMGPLVLALGAELLDVEMLTEDKKTVVRFSIYRPEGVTLDDCAAVQKVIGDRLEVSDPIKGGYTLEVSSPGLERKLRRPREFEIYKGRICQVNLYAAMDGKKAFVGRLVGADVGEEGVSRVTIETEDGVERSFDPKSVSKVALVFDGASTEDRRRRGGGGKNGD